METRKLVKALAGKEDLLVGIGKVQQQRVTGIKDITKINTTELMGALVVDTIDNLISLNTLELGDTKTVIVKDINAIFKLIDNNWVSELATVDTIEELENLKNDTYLIKSCVVKDKDRGGIFVYDDSKATVNDGGIVFNGWVRLNNGIYNGKWFGDTNKIIIDIDALPTLDPFVPGQLWLDIDNGNVLRVSQGWQG